MKFKPLVDEDALYACEESLDDRHTESLTFVCDDQGEWFVQTKVDQGAYTAQSWWMLRGDDLGDLGALLDAARLRDKATP